MGLNARTSARLGQWFSNYLDPAGGEQASAAMAPTTPAGAVTTGLLSDGAKSGASPIIPLAGDATAATRPQPTTPTGSPLERPPEFGGAPLAPSVKPPTDPTYVPPSIPAPPAAPAPAGPSAHGAPGAPAGNGLVTNADGTTTLDLNALDKRVVDPSKETVGGQITGLLADNSDYIQGFRERSKREANARGLLNSSIAVGAGEEAAAAGALNVATPDAATYGKASDYNIALMNQGRMFNADAMNKMSLEQLAAATQKQVAAGNNAATMAAASVSAATSRYNSEVAANASRYGADVNARTNADNNAARRRDQELADARAAELAGDRDHRSLVNNILMNGDIPPERRRELLLALGETDLANSIYVVDSTTEDLNDYGLGNGRTDDSND